MKLSNRSSVAATALLWAALVFLVALLLSECCAPNHERGASVFSPIDRGAVVFRQEDAAPPAIDTSFVAILLCGVGPMTTAYVDSADATTYQDATPRPTWTPLFYARKGARVVFVSNWGCPCPSNER